MEDSYFSDLDERHPINIVEVLANKNEWLFERTSDKQISVMVTGQWNTYQVTIAWSTCDETLRLICTFVLKIPKRRSAKIYELINLINDRCWAGAFSYWTDQRMMTYRYGLILSGGSVAEPEQIFMMMVAAVQSAEQYYPAIQLVACGDKTPANAIGVAINKAYGRA